MRALNTAATGMQAQQLNVEVIANNIANMNTTGFKRQRAEFQDLLYQNVERMGVQSSDAGTIVPTGVQVGVGVKAGSVYRVTEQGSITQTQNLYDVAIQGEGYFIVQLPDGRDAYTRAGNFSLSADGQVVTEDGFIVAPGITVPQDAVGISINRQGVVQVIMADGSDPQEVGAL
jgi:flagellar basal-body rod protein FlgG